MIKGIQPSLAEGGKIKIGGLGEERTSRGGKKWRAPVKLDHFLITGTQRDDRGDLRVDDAIMGAMQADSDGEVRAIPIVLHSDNIDEVFPTSYAMYSGRKLACRGDGEVATRWAFNGNARTSETKQCACPCSFLNNRDGGPMCKPHGTLHCSIIAPGHAVAGAVHKWRTTSLISIQRMIGSLQQILATCGTLRGLPLWLKLEAIQVQPDGVGASTVYCCHVELRASDLLSVQRKALEVMQMRNALSGGGAEIDRAYRALIAAPAGDQETEEEQGEVADEFFANTNVIDGKEARTQPTHQPQRRDDKVPTMADVRRVIEAARKPEDLAPVQDMTRKFTSKEKAEIRTLFDLKRTELYSKPKSIEPDDDYSDIGDPPMSEEQQAEFGDAMANDDRRAAGT